MNLRIFWSSTSSSAKSCLLAYQLLSQSTMIPVRNPVGRTFCPMRSLLSGSLLAVPQGDVDVGITPLDGVGGAPRTRLDALHDRPAIDAGLGDDQVVDVAGAAVLRVAQGALEH